MRDINAKIPDNGFSKNHRIRTPNPPETPATTSASFLVILPVTKGLTFVLSISLSKSRSIIWLYPFEDPVTKKPPKHNQHKSTHMIESTAMRYPKIAEKTTSEANLSLKKAA